MKRKYQADIKLLKRSGMIGYHKKRFSNVFITSIFGVIIFYFSYHAISGEKGLLTMVKLHSRLEKAETEHEKVKIEKAELENKVNRLYDKSLDLDLVDEQTRKLLGYSGQNEIVVIIPKKKAVN